MATAAIAAIATAGITYFATGSILAAVVMAGLSTIGYFLSPKPKIESEVKPASLSDFSITQAQEGIPIPLIYGQVTIPGNLIYYGNLVTERVTENVETGGGKGGHHHSSTQVTKGYKYYLDVWQAIAEGKIVLIEYYRDNDPSKKVEAQDVIWNDGTMDTYPTHLELANKLPGVAHIFFKKLYCGFNRTYLPTIYFKVMRNDSYINVRPEYSDYGPGNGMNPVDILYDLLINQAGIDESYIDLVSFRKAKEYFIVNKIGLNYAITSTRKIKDLIEEICNLCNCILRYNENGQIEIVMLEENQKSVATIDNDFLSFQLSIPSINSLPNDFKANFVDAQTNTVKTIHLENIALKEATGKVNSVTYDLTMINNEELALKLLSNFIKKESYPKVTLKLKLPIKYSFLNIGDVVNVKNDEIGIEGKFRVLSITENTFKEQSIELTLLQCSEIDISNLNEDNIGFMPERPSTELDINLVPFTNIKVYELDYTKSYGETPAFLILVAREKGIETGFQVYYSFTGSDYKLYGTFTTFACAGELSQDYPDNTYTIDDKIGIVFRPYKESEFIYDSISRIDLFNTNRFILIDDELMTFQTVTPVGDTDYKLTGVIRELNWTMKQNHTIGAKVFISEMSDNILSGNIFSTPFYLKIVPICGGRTLSLEDVEAIYVKPTMKARKPITPEKVIAKRNNLNPTNVNVDVFVVSKLNTIGAGKDNPSITTDQYPFEYEGIIVAQINDEPEMYFDSPNFTIKNRPEAFTLKIKTRWNGFDSDVITVNVPAV